MISDRESHTPLHWAIVKGGRLNVVELLISEGADVNAKVNFDSFLVGFWCKI